MFNWFKKKKWALSGGDNPVRISITVHVEHSPIQVKVEHSPLRVEQNGLQIFTNKPGDAQKESSGGIPDASNPQNAAFEPEISIPTNLAFPEVGFGKKVT